MALISTLTGTAAALTAIAASSVFITLAPLLALFLLYPLATAAAGRAIGYFFDRQEQLAARPDLPYYNPKPYFG
ncbi:hypothetical protein [Leisingera sp. ANG-Vp]|uniref:hypothetical protein n=1 Tax=Leisingera sp. ANG-Vp TaxID=1577896 RepID=UPI000580A68A|nr:hypothetical protein [Leisingera sp. ANG-Vp]KIC13576.1 hypothetical protein RA20_23275 [Leisingera sp. ANG-Vp]